MTEFKDPSPDCPEDFFRMRFPSLNYDKNTISFSKGERLFPEHLIMEHCLDKQIVKEVIKRVIKDLVLYPYDGGLEKQRKEQIIKAFELELGF